MTVTDFRPLAADAEINDNPLKQPTAFDRNILYLRHRQCL